jgi:deoxycytidylate deaminase
MAAELKGPSLPEWILLEEFAQRRAWMLAFRQAERSPSQRFRMGACIVDSKDRVLATGCSHVSEYNPQDAATTHAERHALMRGSHLNLQGCSVLVVALNKRGDGCPWSCCPCKSCARALYNRGISWVVYPQRNRDGSWGVHRESPVNLLERASEGDGQFARQQRTCEVAV